MKTNIFMAISSLLILNSTGPANASVFEDAYGRFGNTGDWTFGYGYNLATGLRNQPVGYCLDQPSSPSPALSYVNTSTSEVNEDTFQDWSRVRDAEGVSTYRFLVRARNMAADELDIFNPARKNLLSRMLTFRKYSAGNYPRLTEETAALVENSNFRKFIETCGTHYLFTIDDFSAHHILLSFEELAAELDQAIQIEVERIFTNWSSGFPASGVTEGDKGIVLTAEQKEWAQRANLKLYVGGNGIPMFAEHGLFALDMDELHKLSRRVFQEASTYGVGQIKSIELRAWNKTMQFVSAYTKAIAPERTTTAGYWLLGRNLVSIGEHLYRRQMISENQEAATKLRDRILSILDSNPTFQGRSFPHLFFVLQIKDVAFTFNVAEVLKQLDDVLGTEGGAPGIIDTFIHELNQAWDTCEAAFEHAVDWSRIFLRRQDACNGLQLTYDEYLNWVEEEKTSFMFFNIDKLSTDDFFIQGR